MSIKQTVAKFVNKHAETSEHHPAESLRTHYYKTKQEDASQAVRNILSSMSGSVIRGESKERGELSADLDNGKAFLVATAVTVKPFRTAVDFSVSMNSSIVPFGLGYPSAKIEFLYRELNKELSFIGTGLADKL
ncbi:hypothetical protein [Bacillus marinisedimentorum]|uniref:hypothetical protein n=1 Tax=Bacillus marinisedimentorum TaxID=1821260 RepID=UPI000871C0BB|nr:hypothetical protein [Bacillus marinisedimentorum]